MKHITLKLIALLCLSYVVLLGILYFNQRNMMYHPNTNQPDYSDLAGQYYDVVEIETPQSRILSGLYIPPRRIDNLIIVFFHGNSGNIEHRLHKAKALSAMGYGVYVAGYRGFGGNEGSPTESGLYEDARAQIDWLIANDTTPSHIVLYGESLGSGVATQMALEYETAALILEAPFDSTMRIAQARYPFVPVSLLMKDKYRNDRKIAKVGEPLLIMHGDKDVVVPIKFGHMLFNEAVEPKTFVETAGAGHNNLYDFDAPLHVSQFLSTIKPRSDVVRRPSAQEEQQKQPEQKSTKSHALPQRYNR